VNVKDAKPGDLICFVGWSATYYYVFLGPMPKEHPLRHHDSFGERQYLLWDLEGTAETWESRDHLKKYELVRP
jgi:hypothetical protein